MFLLRWLCRCHDALTDAGYVVGTLGLFSLVAIYCYEVLTRYFLDLASDWANDTFSNVLCVTIFAISSSRLASISSWESKSRLRRSLRFCSNLLICF